MIKFCILTLAAISGVSTAAQAAQHSAFDFYYEQDLEGVYSQGWTVIDTGYTDGRVFDVYVRGEGKLGTFVGILSVNCAEPQFSDWSAVGGYPSPENVPIEVIRGARSVACR